MRILLAPVHMPGPQDWAWEAHERMAPCMHNKGRNFTDAVPWCGTPSCPPRPAFGQCPGVGPRVARPGPLLGSNPPFMRPGAWAKFHGRACIGSGSNYTPPGSAGLLLDSHIPALVAHGLPVGSPGSLCQLISTGSDPYSRHGDDAQQVGRFEQPRFPSRIFR